MNRSENAAISQKRRPEQPDNSARIDIIQDVLTDSMELIKPRVEGDLDAHIQRLLDANPEISSILITSSDTETAREKLYTYLNEIEKNIFRVENPLHVLENAIIRECICVFKSILGPINERRTGFSALATLRNLACPEKRGNARVSAGFIMEFIYLFRGLAGKSNIYYEKKRAKKGIPKYLLIGGREAAEIRTKMLNDIGAYVQENYEKYPSGLEPEIVERRKRNRRRILTCLKGSNRNWNDPKWQLRNVIRTPEPLFDLIELTDEQKSAVKEISHRNIPFGITPYYLSLMDRELSTGMDEAVRMQVIPPPEYVKIMSRHLENREIYFDFMGEHDTSPKDLITRRYPRIAILKPFNTCAQICVYCQRNWEIDDVCGQNACVSKEKIKAAIEWLGKHPEITDILVTGGDPVIMNEKSLHWILQMLSEIEHIIRIRLGTRTPVVLPMKWDRKFTGMIKKFHEPGRREIAVMTHFEHPYEITPEACDAVQQIKQAGISVYNQQVFTLYNSRRFESAKLRTDLRKIGVDPYYTFNMQGKEETRQYMVPIARLMQERKEESRLMPGLDRTDEPVFNVPRHGKNHLRAMQDHRIVMILPNGARVYEFHPWEKNLKPLPPYNYVDVPIYEYLEKLAARGEDISEYRSIWYYY